MRSLRDKLYDSLLDYWQKIVDDLVQSLYDVGRVASGVTAQRIGDLNTNLINITAQGFRVTISMPPYYEFIDEGVSGAKRNTGISRFRYKDKIPPISAIRKFMLNRGINPTPKNTQSGKKRDAEDIRNSIAYAIAYKIWSDGLQPTNFYSKVINDPQLQEFEQRLLEQFSNFVIDIVRLEN